MKRTFLCTIFCAVAFLATGTTMNAQPNPCKCKLKPSATVYLYPEGQLSAKGLEEAQGPIESNGYVKDEYQEGEGHCLKTGDEARMELYFPKKPNGQMVICCPGGGYKFTSGYNEGTFVAEWMISRGITVCVVKYRLPNGHSQLPLQDVQNAFRYCRAHAKEWKVNHIGIIGFSAGGHLAASASTLFVDEITRPDFSVLIYPVITMNKKLTHKGTRHNLIGSDKMWEDELVPFKVWKEKQEMHRQLLQRYSLDMQVTKNTPATFIAVCQDDRTVPVENSMLYYNALQKNKVQAEIHIWPTGGHGWGFRKQAYQPEGVTDPFGYARGEFEASLDRWLKQILNQYVEK